MIDKYIEKVMYSKEFSPFGVKEKVFFYREMAFLLDGGVSIVDALEIIQTSQSHSTLQYITESLTRDLNQGISLASSMQNMSEYFSDSDINIIKSGESMGQMTTVLKYLANEYEFLQRIRNKYISAITYPALLFVICTIAIYALFTGILPGIFDMVKQFEGVEIPATTQFLMNTTTFMQNNSTSIVAGFLLLIAMIFVMNTTESGKRKGDVLMFNLPIVGPLSKQYNLIKFLRYMRLLIYSGLQYIEVFEFLKDIMSHTLYKEAINDVIQNMQSGMPIAATLAKYSNFIPIDVIVLLRVGEETATFDKALENAILMYEDEFQKSLDGLSKLLEPILIVLVGGVIAVTAISVFGVIGNLLGSLQS
jgi:type IV pilus assembly protein PilC